MNGYTLGLDLGSNSIGWALIDEECGSIMATGVRIFPEGVDRDQQGGEQSKNEARRIARGMRRQIARRALRKRKLRSCLQEVGLWPLDLDAAVKLEAIDPYELRRRGLDQRLQPMEIGRVLLHLVQRRGFLSNRKTDRAKANETKGMLKEISELEAKISASGHRTLGEHFAAHRANNPLERVRGRHTRRDMYEREFDLIWQKQGAFHPQLLTEELRTKLDDASSDGTWLRRGIIFGQRRMYWPKSVVGVCELEPKKKRCPKADRVAQRFRLLQEVNNLRLLDSTDGRERALSPNERAKLIGLLERSKEMKFDIIRKKLGLLESVRFNYERAERDKLKGMESDATLASKKLFGVGWYERPDLERNEIVRVVLAGDEDKLRDCAVRDWGLNGEQVEALLEVDLGEGYASLSREAIEKLLPFMERGLPLMTRDDTPCALREAGYLRPDQRELNQRDTLPPPPDITNPLVRQGLHEVRKLVNAIIREFGKPGRIHIELTREVKGTEEQRKKMSKDNWERNKARDGAAEEIRKLGVGVTRDAIDRYLLWEEQNRVCVYSGRSISQAQLFGGEVDVDHVLPRYRSLDNSMMNRVVCFRDENRLKGDRTPYEWLAAVDPEKYDRVLQHAKDLPYAKLRRFRQQEITLDDFVSRQLSDTAYITRKVHEYVQCLGVDVVCTKGQLTADLRHHWGLNDVLRHDHLQIKNRDDHRHHAVDAIVIALMNRSRLHALSKMYQREGLDSAALPKPWDSFRADVENAVNLINVSHRVRRSVSGALHEETIYGPTFKPHRAKPEGERPWAKEWIEDSERFVYRKPLEGLTLSMVDDIRDRSIREIVIAKLAEFGLSPNEKKKIPKEVWAKPLTMPSGTVIKKVRLLKRDESIVPIRGGTCHVKPGSTHHLTLFIAKDRRGRPKRIAEYVSMLEAISRIQKREPIIRRQFSSDPQAEFLMSLSKNEMVLLKHQGREDLYRFDTGASTSKQMWFRQHAAGGKSSEKLGEVSKSPMTFEGRKVVVDVLGRIRNAND